MKVPMTAGDKLVALFATGVSGVCAYYSLIIFHGNEQLVSFLLFGGVAMLGVVSLIRGTKSI